ncbi:MAG: hypothetical protein V4637_19765 [Pseudomonadota bacterium]
MHADAKDDDDQSTYAASDPQLDDEATPEAPLPVHNIMNVLLPARPPHPRNARVVRLFDIEAEAREPAQGQDDSAEAEGASSDEGHARATNEAGSKRHIDPDSRAAARALRRRSLFAAAGGQR